MDHGLSLPSHPQNTVDKLIKKTNLALVIGTHSWREQFLEAITVSAGKWGGRREEERSPRGGGPGRGCAPRGAGTGRYHEAGTPDPGVGGRMGAGRGDEGGLSEWHF